MIYEFVLAASAPVVPQNKLEVFFFDKTIYTAIDESVSDIGDKYPLQKVKFEPYSDYGVKMALNN